MARVGLDRWLDDPAGVVEEIFAPGGPVADEFPNYQHNPIQVAYARNLARILARGARPETAGLVTPTEADTAVGKTLAILVTSLLNAVLRGKRALVTSYTRDLNRQMMGKDGRVAMAVVSEVTGRKALIAVRRPRSAFASATACRGAAAAIESESSGPSDGDREALASARALRELARWADEAAKRAALAGPDGARAFAGRFDGLIETFREEHPKLERPLDRVPFERYALGAFHKADEQAPYAAYRSASQDADLLVATHAILIIDQASGGSILDPRGLGWSSVVCDEGNRLEDAGRAALGVKRSASAVADDTAHVLGALAGVDVPVERRQAIGNLMLDHADAVDRFLTALKADCDHRAPHPERGYRVRGNEPWIADLRAVVESTAVIIAQVRTLPGEVAMDLHANLMRRQSDFGTFIECIDRSLRAASRKPGEPPMDRAWADPVVDLSPRRRDPSLATVPKRGARVVSRLWRETDVRADAVIVTSATLASPSMTGMNAFLPMLDTIGLTATSNRVGQDLALRFKQTDFGRLVEVWLADPDAPLPSRKAEEGDDFRSPEWLAYACAGIKAALDDRWNPDRNRVFVLCTSFDEARAIAEGLADDVPEDMLVVRGPDDPLRHVVQRFLALESGVLLAVGAWDGIDYDSLADHLVIPRLPFPPPDTQGKTGVFTWMDKDGEERASRAIERMLMLLVQGLGRLFRKKSDAAKVWILDPHIGIPAAGEFEHGPGHERSRSYYLNAFPRRFQAVVDAARVFVKPTDTKPPKPVRRKKAA